MDICLPRPRTTNAARAPVGRGTHALRFALMAALLALSGLAGATTQCPAEFGPKDPLVNLIGWCVVAAGVIGGAALFGFLAWRSRTLRWPARSAVLLAGVAAMLLVWTGGLVLAVSQFFLRC